MSNLFLFDSFQDDTDEDPPEYKYVPKRKYPKYKGGSKKFFREKNFKIHNEFKEDWLQFDDGTDDGVKTDWYKEGSVTKAPMPLTSTTTAPTTTPISSSSYQTYHKLRPKSGKGSNTVYSFNISDTVVH